MGLDIVTPKQKLLLLVVELTHSQPYCAHTCSSQMLLLIQTMVRLFIVGLTYSQLHCAVTHDSPTAAANATIYIPDIQHTDKHTPPFLILTLLLCPSIQQVVQHPAFPPPLPPLTSLAPGTPYAPDAQEAPESDTPPAAAPLFGC